MTEKTGKNPNAVQGYSESKEKLADWIIDKTDYLNGHWSNIMDAEQGGFRADGSHLQSDRIQSIAKQARYAINKFRAELASLRLPIDLGAVKTKCGIYLDNWDNFFYYMSKYDKSGVLDDFGTATRSYNAVDTGLSEILESLGLKTIRQSESPAPSQMRQPPASQAAKEKEIIRVKEVLVKVRCPYCKRLYYETLDECPHCGAKR